MRYRGKNQNILSGDWWILHQDMYSTDNSFYLRKCQLDQIRHSHSGKYLCGWMTVERIQMRTIKNDKTTSVRNDKGNKMYSITNILSIV